MAKRFHFDTSLKQWMIETRNNNSKNQATNNRPLKTLQTGKACVCCRWRLFSSVKREICHKLWRVEGALQTQFLMRLEIEAKCLLHLTIHARMWARLNEKWQQICKHNFQMVFCWRVFELQFSVSLFHSLSSHSLSRRRKVIFVQVNIRHGNIVGLVLLPWIMYCSGIWVLEDNNGS